MEHKAWHIKVLIDTFSKSEWRIVEKCVSTEWLFDRQWWASGLQGKTNLATDPCHCQSNSSIFSLGNRRLRPARIYLVLTAPFLNVTLASCEQTMALTALSYAMPYLGQSFMFNLFSLASSRISLWDWLLSATSVSFSHLQSCLSSHSSTPGPFSSHTFSMTSSCMYDCDFESVQTCPDFLSRPVCLFSCWDLQLTGTGHSNIAGPKPVLSVLSWPSQIQMPRPSRPQDFTHLFSSFPSPVN